MSQPCRSWIRYMQMIIINLKILSYTVNRRNFEPSRLKASISRLIEILIPNVTLGKYIIESNILTIIKIFCLFAQFLLVLRIPAT